MTAKIFDDIISDNERQTICNWFHSKDHLNDVRPDMTSKNPKWEDNDWPKALIRNVLDKVLEEPYQVDKIYFFNFHGGSFRLHCDSGAGAEIDNLYKVVNIPLDKQGDASTVIFGNHWYGANTKFSKKKIPQFEYTLEINGKKEYIQDMRVYKTKDPELKSLLEKLIAKRRNVDNRQYDYSEITNITDKSFDEKIYKKYLSHLPYEDFYGLTLEKVIDWKLGSVFTFDRSQLHCGTNTHTRKTFCTVFTSKASIR